jgi:molybdenum cofactor synthesis domain-containing protein
LYLIKNDNKEQIKEMIEKKMGVDYIITTGGTGISPRDVTPEVTSSICTRELPGISEMLRIGSYKETKNAVFSRAFSGVKDNTIIINFPGSVKAVLLCTKLMIPVLEHGIKMLYGGKH